jgi:sensor histidine kinase regulating citrate/malate metabolism
MSSFLRPLYYTSKETGGHGIGLYKIQKLLKKSKGTITAYYDADENEMVFTVKFN